MVKFSLIRRNKYFKYKGIEWKRIHGHHAQRRDCIGNGNGTRIFSKEDLVESIE